MTRWTLLRDLAHPDQFRAAFKIDRATGTTGGAVRCGISVTLTFLVVALAGHADLAGFASLGALASLYGRDEPYPWRWRLMTLAGLSLAGSVLLCSTLTALGTPLPVQLIAVALIAALATAACTALRSGPPGGTIIVFAAGAGMAAVGGDALAAVTARTLTTLTGAVIAVLVCNAGLAVAAARHRPLGTPPRAHHLLLPALRDRQVLTPAAAIFTAAVAAGAIAMLAGWGHPAWAVMGSTAILHGRDVHHMGQRAIQRALGTVGGAAIAVPLLAAHLPFWSVAVLVVALQTLTEVVVARHYGLAMLTITPMALLMTSIGMAADPVHVAADRALDTLVGALVGVVVAVSAARPGRQATETGEPVDEQVRIISTGHAEHGEIRWEAAGNRGAEPHSDDPAPRGTVSGVRAPAPPASR